MQGPMQSWPLTVDRILDHAAERNPEQEIVTAAASGAARRLSFAAFAQRVGELRAALARAGVRPGDVVDVIGANTARQLECWYAVIGLGAVCHPLSAGMSLSRTAALMRDGGAKVALVDADILERLEPVLLKQPKLERIIGLADAEEPLETRMQGAVSLEAFLEEGRGRAERPGLDEHAPAVLARTVGGSGPPKGVIWTHRACVLEAMAAQGADALAMTAQDVALVLAPFWRAAAWGMVFTGPLAGARLALPGAKTDPLSIRVLADREAATLIVASPAELQALHDQYRSESRRPNGLKRAMAVGAPCPPALVRAWRDSFGVEVRSAWGAVEIGGIGAAGPGVAGLRPCFGVELQVRGADGRMSPAGELGRLWARGPASVESETAADGFVDTGDFASLDAQGRVAWLGRADDQVQASGALAPAWPLESAAMEHPSTARAAAIDPVADHGEGGPVLLVERKPGAVAGKAEYLRFLGDRLGPRTPTDVLFVDGFPLDAAGRIDKRALRERLERVAQASPPAEPEPAPVPNDRGPEDETAPAPEPASIEPAPAIAELAAAAPALFQSEDAEDEPPEGPPEPVTDASDHPKEPPAELRSEPRPPATESADEAEPELRIAEAPPEAPPAEEPGLFIRLEPRSQPRRRRAPRAPGRRSAKEARAELFLNFTALLAVAPVLMILAGGLGVRFDLIDWRVGLNLLVFDLPSKLALVGLLGGVLALFAAATSGGGRYWLRALLSLLLPVAVMAAITWIRSVGESYPPVHDVATDWSDPIDFSPALIRARGPDAYPVEADPVVPQSAGVYMNRRVAEVNAETCADAQPVDLNLSLGQAYARARAAVIADGEQLVTDDPQAGRLEATAVDPWLGFKDDVAVRVRPGPKGARIDFRSSSRGGLWDFGSNCDRVARLVRAIGGGIPDQPAGDR